VHDDARAQSAAGTTAVNHWYADGRFSNSWANPSGSGNVTGIPTFHWNQTEVSMEGNVKMQRLSFHDRWLYWGHFLATREVATKVIYNAPDL
jgi:hypothetical protein